jgi:methylated-DNA-[protein]-cysteine S-methyltransferase
MSMVESTSRAGWRPSAPAAVKVGSSICLASFFTELKWMAIAWRADALAGVTFGHGSRRNAELWLARTPGWPQSFCRFDADEQLDTLPRWVADVTERLRCYAEGERVEFASVPLSLDHLTPFGRRVVSACRRIQWGETRAYGELAAECGSPGAARAVGSVMAKNRYPLIVPCHRVLAAGGQLGGFSAPDGVNTKQRLLEMERVSPPRRPK